MKYKVGDKVRIHDVTDHRKGYNGKEVTIREINPNGKTTYKPNIPHYGVEERNIHYVFWEDELEPVPVNTRKIVITSDGVETLARLYDGNKVIKTATAKCSPDDTFDFKTGAMLAFERLMNEEKKPLTFREKLEQEHPEYVGGYAGGCKGCPKSYGYITEECPRRDKKVKSCRECWDREIPKTKEEPKFKFEIGKQYIGSNSNGSLVIEITGAKHFAEGLNAINRYEYKVVKGTDNGMLRFGEESQIAKRFKPYDPPKYFNGKAVCIATKPFFAYTVGKVYEFEDGTTVINNGNRVYTDEPVASIEEWNEKHGEYAKMLKIVE